MQKTRLLKVKNSLSELENNFIELQDRELKDTEVKTKREIEGLFFNLITLFVDGMNKSVKDEMKKKRHIKNLT